MGSPEAALFFASARSGSWREGDLVRNPPATVFSESAGRDASATTGSFDETESGHDLCLNSTDRLADAEKLPFRAVVRSAT